MKSIVKRISGLLRAVRPAKNKSTDVSGRANKQANQFATEYLAKAGQREADRLRKDKEKNIHRRDEERFDCFVVGQLVFPETGAVLEGAILDASPNGVTFRPATSYLQERSGEIIELRAEGLLKNGIVRSSRADGYGIQLYDALLSEDLDALYQASIDKAA